MSLIVGLLSIGAGVVGATNYHITNCTQLQNMCDDLAGTYILDNDINCSDTINWNGMAGFIPIGNESGGGAYKFTGHFFGQGYNITNLYMNRNNYVGLFGYADGYIEKIGLKDVNITGSGYCVGGLVGLNKGMVTNSSCTGNVSGNDRVGGLVGYDDNADVVADYYVNIKNCFSAAGINGSTSVGGLVGEGQTEGGIEDSYWDINVSGQSSSFGGEGKTTTEMQQQATYVGWDFVNVWNISGGYPILIHEGEDIPSFIEINEVGNISESTFGADTSSHHYRNGTWQIEDWIYINISAINPDGSIENVTLQWKNETGWYNYSMNSMGNNYWDINITDQPEWYGYTFNITVEDSSSETTTYIWNYYDYQEVWGSKESWRKYIGLNATPESFSYEQYYLYAASYENNQLHDRVLPHEQPTDGTISDTGLLYYEQPYIDQERYCNYFTGFFIDENEKVSGININNIYQHVWWQESSGTLKIGYKKERNSYFTSGVSEFYSSSSSQSKQNITVSGFLYSDYHLEINLWDISNPSFSDNDINLFASTYSYIDGNNPCIISDYPNYFSFIILNLPSNETLQGLDTDSDGLTDYEELFTYYSDPKDNDTDGDGKLDADEVTSGSNILLVDNSPCTTPFISDLTNSTPGTTNITITWATNQSADNRVKYSKNSDLSNELWSSWHNDTSSISIAITSLDSGTPYYYQATSYNGTNSSCSVTEPVSSPYKNFTTQSDGAQSTTTDTFTANFTLQPEQPSYFAHGQALADAINANDTAGVHASYATDVVTVTADTSGEAGNSITTTETIANASFASGSLTGGGASSTPWSEYQHYGLGLWTAIGGLIILVAIVIVLGLVISGVISLSSSGGGEPESNIPVLIGASVGVAALVIVIGIIPFMGYSVENIMPLSQDSAASGTLTFTGDAVDGETVTISNGVQTDIYEFDTDNSVAGGNIKVGIS